MNNDMFKGWFWRLNQQESWANEDFQELKPPTNPFSPPWWDRDMGWPPIRQQERQSNNYWWGWSSSGWKSNWFVSAWYYFWLILVLMILIVYPIYDLLFSSTWAISVLTDVVKQDASLSERDDVYRLIFQVIAAFLIFMVVKMPWDFKSALSFSWNHVLDWLWKINSDIFKADKDTKNLIFFKTGIYFWVSLILFSTYIYLISQILSIVNDNNLSVITYLWMMVVIGVIAMWNAWVVKILDEKDPEPKYKDWIMIASKKSEFKDASTRIIWWIILAVVNIILLWLSYSVSDYFESKIQDTQIGNILQWDIDLNNLMD
jgi:hypothetical protein